MEITATFLSSLWGDELISCNWLSIIAVMCVGSNLLGELYLG